MILSKLFHPQSISVKHPLFLFSLVFVFWTIFRYFPEPPLWISELVLKPLLWLLPTFWLVKSAEKRPLSSLGFTKKNLFPALYWGLGLGLVFAFEGLITHILKYRGFHLISLEPNPFKFLAMILLSFGTAFSEETVFRGYIFNRLWQIWNKEWLANIVSSFLFALIHLPIGIFILGYNPSVMIAYLLLVFVFGFGSAFVFARSGNIASSILLHVFWSWPIALFR